MSDAGAVRVDKEVTAVEVIGLMAAVGWGVASAYDETSVARSIAAYPFVAHARDGVGRLIGYATAFSDGAFSVFIGELVVHPSARRRGVGSRLLAAIDRYAAGVPIYATPFADGEGFFLRRGYRRAQRPMSVLFK